MHPTIDFNWFEVPTFTVLVAIGAAAGLLAAYLFLRTRSRRASTPEVFLDATILVLVFGWIGARAYHVASHWEYYAARPEEIAQPGLGGLGIRGGLVLGLIALVAYARIRRISFWHLADAAAIGLAIGQAIGWFGALIEGSNYGAISDSPIAVDLPDLYGLVQTRFPVQALEIALFTALFLGLVLFASTRPRAGTVFLVFALLASTGNLVLGFQRGDDTLYVGALRIDQVFDAAFAVLAAGFWVARRARRAPALSDTSLGSQVFDG